MITINFPLRTAFAESLRFWIIPQETRKALNRQPNYTSKGAGKRTTITTKKTKVRRRKEIIKIRAEINEKKRRKQ